MPFIRVTRRDNTVIDVNISKIIQFHPHGGNTRLDLVDNISHDIVDEPRQLRGYIKKAEGTLPLPNADRIIISGPDTLVKQV